MAAFDSRELMFSIKVAASDQVRFELAGCGGGTIQMDMVSCGKTNRPAELMLPAGVAVACGMDSVPHLRELKETLRALADEMQKVEEALAAEEGVQPGDGESQPG
jgi:hypothetical protein